MPATPTSNSTPQVPGDSAPLTDSAAQVTHASGWWQARLKEHPFNALSLAVLTSGGFILLMFFVHLGVMPELDLVGASSTLAAVAVIGLLAVVSLGGTTIAAGITTRNLASSQPNLFSSSWAVGAFALPGITFFLAFALCNAWGDQWSISSLGMWILVEMGVLLGIRAFCVWRAGTLRTSTSAVSNQWMPWFELFMGLVGGGCLWLLMPALAVLSFVALWPGDRSQTDFGWLLCAWGLLCVAINVFVVYLPKERELGGMTFMALGSVIILVALTQNWSGIPLAAVRTLGLGETAVGLVLTERGCNTVNQATRDQAICHLDVEKKLGWVCPAVLKSRIGSPFVVEVSSFDTDGRWPVAGPSNPDRAKAHPSATLYQRIPISKEDVLSWPAVTRLTKPGGKYLFDPAHLASYLDQGAKGLSQEQADWLRAQCGNSPPRR